MAKTTKKTVAKKNAKTSKSFWQRLVPRTPRAKLLTFLIVFAVMGGSVMAYRSFAATGAGVYYYDKLTVTNGYRIDETSGLKKGMSVAVLNLGSSVKIASQWEPVIWAPYVRACANLRAGSSPVNSATVALTYDGYTYTATNLVASSTTYTKWCTAFVSHSNPNSRVGGYVRNNSTAALYVGSIALEYDSGGAGK